MGVKYSEMGHTILEYKHQELIATVSVKENPKLVLKSAVTIPGRTVAVLNVKYTSIDNVEGQICEVQPNHNLTHEHPNVFISPTIHVVDNVKPANIPFVLVNLSQDSIHIPKGEIMGN